MKQKEIFDIKIKMAKIQKAFEFMNGHLEEKTKLFLKEINERSKKRKKRQSISLFAYWVIFFGLLISKNVLNMPILVYNVLFFTNVAVLLGHTIYSAIALKKDNNKYDELTSVIPGSMALQMTVALYLNTLQQSYNDEINGLTDEEKEAYKEYESSHEYELEEIFSLELDENSVEDLLNSIVTEKEEPKKDDNDEYQEYLDLTEEYASHIKNIVENNETVALSNKKLELK